RPVPVPSVLVADVPAALAALARSVVDALPAARIAGITGSSGKTSTKDLAAQLVERLGPTIAPAGSYNNEFGHPLTVLRADAATRFLVLELSARGIGHIAYPCPVAPPRGGPGGRARDEPGRHRGRARRGGRAQPVADGGPPAGGWSNGHQRRLQREPRVRPGGDRRPGASRPGRPRVRGPRSHGRARRHLAG